MLVMSMIHQTTLSAANETRSRVQVGRASWLPLCPQQGLAQVTGTCSKKETQHSDHTALSSRALTWFIVLTALELPAAPRNHMTSAFRSRSSLHLLGPITGFLPPSPPFWPARFWELSSSFSWRQEDFFIDRGPLGCVRWEHAGWGRQDSECWEAVQVGLLCSLGLTSWTSVSLLSY